MKIQLDTNAMNALFPEGSQARVDLQSAVIANFATRIRDNKIDSMVRSAVCHALDVHSLDEIVDNAVKKMYLQNLVDSSGHSTELSRLASRIGPNTPAYKAIAHTANDIASLHKTAIINAGVKEATDRLNDHLTKAQDKLIALVDEQFLRIDAKVRELVKRRVDEIIAIELNNKIEAARNGAPIVR